MLSLGWNRFALLMVVAVGPALAGSSPAAVTGPLLSAETRVPDPAVARIGPEEVERLVRAGDVLVVDVRPHDVYLRGHLPGAVSIPVDQLEEALPRLRAANTRIVLYCDGQAGLKSGRAAALLEEHGVERVACLEGGYQCWVASGRVVFAEPTDL